MDRATFERLVADALASIPPRFRDAMHNIAIVVEDEPSADLLDEMEIEPPDTLLGLYQGTPLTERHWGLRQHPARSHPALSGSARARIRRRGRSRRLHRETLIHEIGHYFGMSEEEIEEIEEQYWAGTAEDDDEDGEG